MIDRALVALSEAGVLDRLAISGDAAASSACAPVVDAVIATPCADDGSDYQHDDEDVKRSAHTSSGVC